jgi:hypothetical protein
MTSIGYEVLLTSCLDKGSNQCWSSGIYWHGLCLRLFFVEENLSPWSGSVVWKLNFCRTREVFNWAPRSGPLVKEVLSQARVFPDLFSSSSYQILWLLRFMRETDDRSLCFVCECPFDWLFFSFFIVSGWRSMISRLGDGLSRIWDPKRLTFGRVC